MQPCSSREPACLQSLSAREADERGTEPCCSTSALHGSVPRCPTQLQTLGEHQDTVRITELVQAPVILESSCQPKTTKSHAVPQDPAWAGLELQQSHTHWHYNSHECLWECTTNSPPCSARQNTETENLWLEETSMILQSSFPVLTSPCSSWLEQTLREDKHPRDQTSSCLSCLLPCGS